MHLLYSEFLGIGFVNAQFIKVLFIQTIISLICNWCHISFWFTDKLKTNSFGGGVCKTEIGKLLLLLATIPFFSSQLFVSTFNKSHEINRYFYLYNSFNASNLAKDLQCPKLLFWDSIVGNRKGRWVHLEHNVFGRCAAWYWSFQPDFWSTVALRKRKRGVKRSKEKRMGRRYNAKIQTHWAQKPFGVTVVMLSITSFVISKTVGREAVAAQADCIVRNCQHGSKQPLYQDVEQSWSQTGMECWTRVR